MSFFSSVFNDFRKLRHPNMSDQKWLRSRPGCPCFLLGLPFLPKPSNNKQTCNENLVERCVKKRTTHQHRINKTHKTLISVSVLLMILPHPIAGHVPDRSLSARSLVSPPITGPAECTKRSNTRFRVGAWPKALKFQTVLKSKRAPGWPQPGRIESQRKTKGKPKETKGRGKLKDI